MNCVLHFVIVSRALSEYANPGVWGGVTVVTRSEAGGGKGGGEQRASVTTKVVQHRGTFNFKIRFNTVFLNLHEQNMFYRFGGLSRKTIPLQQGDLL